MAKSASFFSANSFTWRGVMTCSASALRSSGLSGGMSSPASSPFTRTVGGRPTLRSRFDALRWTIWPMLFLKLNDEAGAPPEGVSAIGIDPEEDLAVFHRLGVVHADLPNDAGDLGLDLVHDLHRLDDADRLSRAYPRPHLGVGIRPGLGRLVEGPHHRRFDVLERRCGGPRSLPPVALGKADGRGPRRRRQHRRRHRHRREGWRGGGPGDHHPGPEESLDLDGPDLRRVAKQLRQPLDVLELDGLDAGHLLQQLGELLHLLWRHTRDGPAESRRSSQVTDPSWKSGAAARGRAGCRQGLLER